MASIQVILLIIFVAISFVGFQWWVQKKMIEHDKNDHPPSKKETSNAAKTVAQQSDTAKTPAAFEFTPLSFLQSMMVPSVHQEGFVNSSMQYQFV